MDDSIQSGADQRSRGSQGRIEAHRVGAPTVQHDVSLSIEPPQNALEHTPHVVQLRMWLPNEGIHPPLRRTVTVTLE
jgi:hypothetical protein